MVNDCRKYGRVSQPMHFLAISNFKLQDYLAVSEADMDT